MPQQYQFLLFFYFYSFELYVGSWRQSTPEPLQMSLPRHSLQSGSHGDQEDPGLQITQAGPVS